MRELLAAVVLIWLFFYDGQARIDAVLERLAAPCACVSDNP